MILHDYQFWNFANLRGIDCSKREFYLLLFLIVVVLFVPVLTAVYVVFF
jgi:hypothetical protein